MSRPSSRGGVVEPLVDLERELHRAPKEAHPRPARGQDDRLRWRPFAVLHHRWAYGVLDTVTGEVGPDASSIAAFLDAPGLRQHRHDREPAPGGALARDRRRSHRRERDHPASVLHADAHSRLEVAQPDVQVGAAAVQGGVRCHLGDAQGGVVDEVLAAPLQQSVDDEPARSGDAGGVGGQSDSQLRMGPAGHGRHRGIVPRPGRARALSVAGCVRGEPG